MAHFCDWNTPVCMSCSGVEDELETTLGQLYNTFGSLLECAFCVPVPTVCAVHSEHGHCGKEKVAQLVLVLTWE